MRPLHAQASDDMKTNVVATPRCMQTGIFSAFAYGAAALGAAGGDGLANFVASMGAFTCTSVSSIVERPSSQVTVMRNGMLTPETSR